MSLKTRTYVYLYRWSRRKVRNSLSWKEAKSEGINKSYSPIFVTDHAVLRYLQRVEGYEFDINEIKNKLAPSSLINTIYESGDGKYVIDNSRVTVVGYAVVTVDNTRHDRPLQLKHINRIKGLIAPKTTE